MSMDLHERLSGSAAGDMAPTGPDPFAELKNRIHLGLIEDLGRQIFTRDAAQTGTPADVTAEIRSRLEQEPGISREDRERLVGELADDILGHGPLERLLADDTIPEIRGNGPHDVWIGRGGPPHRTTARSRDESPLRRGLAQTAAG